MASRLSKEKLAELVKELNEDEQAEVLEALGGKRSSGGDPIWQDVIKRIEALEKRAPSPAPKSKGFLEGLADQIGLKW